MNFGGSKLIFHPVIRSDSTVFMVLTILHINGILRVCIAVIVCIPGKFSFAYLSCIVNIKLMFRL